MDKPNPYGVRAVRHLKSATGTTSRKRLDRSGRVCSTKQAVMDRTYDYFLREVDPIIGECITHLLCIRPDNVAATMLDFLEKRQKGERPVSNKGSTEKATKTQRLYLATQISPVITKLVNRIATTRPEQVLDFMCSELRLLLDKPGQEGSLNNRESISTPNNNTNANMHPNTSAPVSNAGPKNMNIIFLGAAGAGKSSFIDAIQGKFNDSIRPTIGFRPTSMMMGDDKVRFYDIGGGLKIRKIWPEYFHDAHAVVYMVDSSETDSSKITEGVQLFKDTMQNPMLRGKPTVFLSNKQDRPDSKSKKDIQDLYSIDSVVGSCIYSEVSCVAGGPESNHPGEPDPRLEAALEQLLLQVQDQYGELNVRVEADTAVKNRLADEKRREKERKILRNKIVHAFPGEVDKSFVTEDTPKQPDDTFTADEGVTFLAAEIGAESLCAEGREVAALVGHQRLALQMVGALISPISKKKVAMSWDQCRALVRELRSELGLPAL